MRGLPSDSGTRLQQAASYLREDALMTIPVIAAAIITCIVGYLLMKRYPIHMLLLIAGLSIIVIAILCGAQNILPKGVKSTGFIGFDIVELIQAITKKQLIGVGLILMASGGFAIVTVLTGSGVGVISAFGSISADIAHQMNGELAAMLVPIQLASSVFRTMSPVAGCLIAAALIAGVSPMSIVRRTAIPAVVTFAAIFAMNMFMNF